MRALLDWLDAHVEPYVSFRFIVGLILTAIFVNWAVGTVFWLRELARPSPASSGRERQMLRIGRLYTGLLLLRLVSWRTLRDHGGLLLQLVALLGLAIALSTGVFVAP